MENHLMTKKHTQTFSCLCHSVGKQHIQSPTLLDHF